MSACAFPLFSFSLPSIPGFALPEIPKLPNLPNLPGIAFEMPNFSFGISIPGFALPEIPELSLPKLNCPFD